MKIISREASARSAHEELAALAGEQPESGAEGAQYMCIYIYIYREREIDR